MPKERKIPELGCNGSPLEHGKDRTNSGDLTKEMACWNIIKGEIKRIRIPELPTKKN